MGTTMATLPLLVLTLLFALPAGAQEVPELRITSKHYIVVDADTGEVFAQRGAHDQVPMASLTKIFTSIEAIESAPSDAQITTSSDDLVSADATQMGFGPGETFPLKDLIFGMLLPSGNDAARAVARSLGAQPGDTPEQSVDRFVARTNQRIQDMGLTDTNLVDPDGWGVPGHHSSAHDLAIFTMYAMHYPRFVEAISSERYQTESGGYLLTNTNKLLDTYDGLIGGKTGYDDDAGYCLVEVARRDGSTMISVTLDGVAPGDWYDDDRVLLDYAFEQKAARASTGVGILGERVAYRDPDAAVIARSAKAGASLGIPAAIPTVTGQLGHTAPPLLPAGAGSPAGGATLIGADRQTRDQPFAALAVAVAVILGSAVRAFRQFQASATGAAPSPSPRPEPLLRGNRHPHVRLEPAPSAEAPPSL